MAAVCHGVIAGSLGIQTDDFDYAPFSRHGRLGVVDKLLEEGPVHVIKSDQPRYVVMTEAHYGELVDAFHETTAAGIREALEDVRAGRARNHRRGVDP